MVKKMMSLLLICALLFGCDSFPGPSLRNEFPTEIKVSIIYGDRTKYSETWPSCRTVSVGASEIGRFGVRSKDVGIDRIVVEVENKVEINLDKEAIDKLLESSTKEKGYPVWVLDGSGIHFSTHRECSLNQGGQ
ncbi:hypothetical protein [Photobacterium sp. 1_MG-2023]|uniref:hypothetical protein n=1 Tax=Photobacterium sp. 1_MG-2023 TaxID=3062646 RepID=UPI0026E1A90C|nr:hypothetical protein [Photobacterium sp. 1_MG-2023]MDO6709000.1 hypothetical protein [Photobacterium sp. 1_MG-2023]